MEVFLEHIGSITPNPRRTEILQKFPLGSISSGAIAQG